MSVFIYFSSTFFKTSAVTPFHKRFEHRPTPSEGRGQRFESSRVRQMGTSVEMLEKQAIIIDTAGITYQLWGQMFSDLVSDWDAQEAA